MTVDFDNNRPIYKQLVEKILLGIANGELSPGARLNPVREMAAVFKVNPNTMQKSLAKLEDMGYLHTIRTSGRYVTRDLELIESLKKDLPAKITEEYIREMLNCGVDPEHIPAYVSRFVQQTKGATGNGGGQHIGS